MRMKKIKEEKGSMAIYVLVTLMTFGLILMTIYITSISVRKAQLSTIIRIKESYEKDNSRIEEIYEEQAIKQNEKEGLLLHYDAINNTGNGHSNTAKIWADLSGNGNDGVIKGEATWQSNSLTLDGIDDYVDIIPTQLNKIEQGTVIITYNLKDWGNENSTLFFKGKDIEPAYNHIQISRNGDSTSEINTIISNNENSTQEQSIIPINVNEKMQIAMTWNGEQLKNYKNGLLNSTIATDILPAQDSTMCYIGKGANDIRMFNGEIYSIRVYNNVLTDEQIQENYTEIQSRYEIQ